MLEGIIRVAYTGATGSGLGILVFHKGSVVGADTGGGTYDGSYTENADTPSSNAPESNPARRPNAIGKAASRRFRQAAAISWAARRRKGSSVFRLIGLAFLAVQP
jgi:hypothetical protein